MSFRFNPCNPCCHPTTGCSLVTQLNPSICTNFNAPHQSSCSRLGYLPSYRIIIKNPSSNVIYDSNTTTGAISFDPPGTVYNVQLIPISGSTCGTYYGSTFTTTLDCVNGFRTLHLPINLDTYTQFLYISIDPSTIPSPPFYTNICADPSIIGISVLYKGTFYTLFDPNTGYSVAAFSTIMSYTSPTPDTFTLITYTLQCDQNGNNCVVVVRTSRDIQFNGDPCVDLYIEVSRCG